MQEINHDAYVLKISEDRRINLTSIKLTLVLDLSIISWQYKKLNSKIVLKNTIKNIRLSDMRMKRELKAYLFLAPALILSVTFFILPFLRSFVSSFLKISQSGRILGFAGLGNYASILGNEYFIRSVLHTFVFAIVFVPLNALITLSAAALTRSGKHPVSEIVFFSPLAFSLSALALTMKQIFRGKVSIINRITGLGISWLSDSVSAMAVIVILGIFLDFALDYMILYASFRSIDRRIIEAAELDGASGVQILMRIELPLIMPAFAAIVFLSVKDALLINAPVMILTEGGPFRSTETIMYYYYLEAFKSGNRAAESVISVIMTLSSAALMAIAGRRRK